MVVKSNNIEARPVNWMPITCIGAVQREQNVEEDDLFSKGEVVKFFPKQGWGYIRNRMGIQMRFDVGEIEFAGEKRDARYISKGKKVGYDMALSDKGCAVTKIKVY